MKLRLLGAVLLMSFSTSLLALDAALTKEIPHLAQPKAELFTAGQPTAAAWALLPKQGIKTVINLRSDSEMADSQEAEQVKAQGLAYVHIPVAGAPDITEANAERLQAALAEAKGPVLVHCASSNRVGALLALIAAKSMPVEEAIAYGRTAGLTNLEPQVRAVLSNQ